MGFGLRFRVRALVKQVVSAGSRISGVELRCWETQ